MLLHPIFDMLKRCHVSHCDFKSLPHSCRSEITLAKRRKSNAEENGLLTEAAFNFGLSRRIARRLHETAHWLATASDKSRLFRNFRLH